MQRDNNIRRSACMVLSLYIRPEFKLFDYVLYHCYIYIYIYHILTNNCCSSLLRLCNTCYSIACIMYSSGTVFNPTELLSDNRDWADSSGTTRVSS